LTGYSAYHLYFRYNSAVLASAGYAALKTMFASVRLIKDSSAIRDIDGNGYATVIINNQEWIYENLKVTHYVDGTPINYCINNLGAELVTGWTNVAPPIDWHVFVSVVNDIILMTSDALAGSICFSNLINPLPNAILYFYIDVTIISDDPPYLWIEEDGADYIYPLAAGVNIFTHNCSPTVVNVTFRLINYDFLLFPGIYHVVNCSIDFNSSVTPGWIIGGAYCWYNNDIANKNPYGALYNWQAVNNAHGLVYFTRNGIYESQWRVPTIGDFNALVAFAGGDGVAGGKFKETGIIHWNAPNTGATDLYHLKFIGAGHRELDGSFLFLKDRIELWSKTVFDAWNAWCVACYNNQESIDVGDADYMFGMSVRCVRDV